MPNDLLSVARAIHDLSEGNGLVSAKTLVGVGFDDWTRLLELGQVRRALPDDSPLLTVLLGPTGAGKSTVFNWIVEESLSRPGAIRPCTMRPLALGSSSAIAKLEADPFLTTRALDLDWRSREEWHDTFDGRAQVLVDTPDFDSVEVENRRRAEALLYRADRIVVVITPEKYGDASVWTLVDQLLPLGSVVGCILNKHEAAGPLEDLTRLLAERAVAAPVTIARSPDPESLTLDATDRQAIAALLRVPDDRRDVAKARIAAVESEETRIRSATIEPWLSDARAGADRVRTRLDSMRSTMQRKLSERLALEIDSALKKELEARFLEQVQKIDILREPRRWIAAPFTWVKSWFDGDEKPDDTPESTAGWLTRLYRDRYSEWVYELCEDLRRVTGEARALGKPPLDWLDIDNPTSEELDSRLRAVFEKLEVEIAQASEKIADGLPMSGKVSFYSSQVIFHTLISVVCIKTGGLFTPAEMAAQGLVSPFVARLIAQYVASGEASTVEEALGAFFASCLTEATVPLLEPLERQLAEFDAAIPNQSRWEQLVTAWPNEARSR